MALVDDLKQILERLAPHGWAELFQAHGLDVTADDLEHELTRPLTSIDRRLSGFSDLSPTCTRAVEPAAPARSLIYHAFASPMVTEGPSGRLTAFPTPADIDVLENFIYASAKRRLADIHDIARETVRSLGGNGDGALAVVMMASEYRNAADTVHGLHADTAYSRTGVARAGTAEPNYVGEARGYWPASATNEIHVIPCVWKPFLCIRAPASRDTLQDPAGFGPMTPVRSDLEAAFWLPLHKLFDGPECLSGEDIGIDWQTHHENTKIARIHAFFESMDVPSLVGQADFQAKPFRMTEGIADFGDGSDLPSGAVVPVPSTAMVAIATDDSDRPVSFAVPPRKTEPHGSIGFFWSSLELRTPGSDRPVPEYLHVRHFVDASGTLRSLNDHRDMMARIQEDGYRAVHYIDFTGAGFVSVKLNGLPEELAVKPGFSIVSAPDFYPMVDQRKVQAWHEALKTANPSIAQNIHWGAPPRPLSTIRLAADPQISDGTSTPFGRQHDDGTQATISAIVATPGEPRTAANAIPAGDVQRCPVLPDAAAGIFAPGWAVSTDTTDGVRHLAAYGLGSPFPEDSKLCAALSAFWPAAAPDTTRTYNPQGPSTAPMTDPEIVGDAPWDGIDGTRFDPAARMVEFPDRMFADYVESAVANRFDIRATAQITFEEYVRRVFRTAQVRTYINQNPRLDIPQFALLSFTGMPNGDPDFTAITAATGATVEGPAYRFVVGTLGQSGATQGNHRRRNAPASRVIEIVAGDNTIVHREGDGWQRFDEAPQF